MIIQWSDEQDKKEQKIIMLYPSLKKKKPVEPAYSTTRPGVFVQSGVCG